MTIVGRPMSSTTLPESRDFSFHTQGPIPPDAAHLYIHRPADVALERLINKRAYVALIGPRLSGKSSMLLRQWARLRQSPLHLPVYISFGPLITLPEVEWYGQLHRQIAQQTGGLLPPPARSGPARPGAGSRDRDSAGRAVKGQSAGPALGSDRGHAGKSLHGVFCHPARDVRQSPDAPCAE